MSMKVRRDLKRVKIKTYKQNAHKTHTRNQLIVNVNNKET